MIVCIGYHTQGKKISVAVGRKSLLECEGKMCTCMCLCTCVSLMVTLQFYTHPNESPISQVNENNPQHALLLPTTQIDKMYCTNLIHRDDVTFFIF